jgi:hypothetical protein
VNFGYLVGLEPNLMVVLADALKIRMAGHKTLGQMSNIWYKDFKPQVENLVGMYVKEGSDKLKTSEAYDCAYETIYSCLTGTLLK